MRWRNVAYLALIAVLVLAAYVASTRAVGGSFNARLRSFAVSELRRRRPDDETMWFVRRNVDFLWPVREDLFRLTAPYLKSEDMATVAAAIETLMCLRWYSPVNDVNDQWQKQNAPFFARIDREMSDNLRHLLELQDDAVGRALAQYLGTTRLEGARQALLQLIERPGVRGQALTCLTWRKNPDDLDDLVPFMLRDDPEASGLAYHLQARYGDKALPALRRVMTESESTDQRLEAACQLAQVGDKAGLEYLHQVVLTDADQLDRVRQFLRDWMRLPKDVAEKEQIVEFLEAQMRK